MVTTNENIINRKIILIKKGLSISDIAKKLTYSRQGVNKAIVGKSRSAAMLLAICDVVGVTKEEFWPEFYVQVVNVPASHDANITAQEGVVN